MRGLLKEEQRGFDRDRALLTRQFCSPVWRNVIRHGVQTGKIQAPRTYIDDTDKWLEVHWIPPAMGWVDPHKEIQAAKEAIDANLSTPWHEAGRAGLDPIEVLERKADYFNQAIEIEKQRGLLPGTLTGAVVSKEDAETGEGQSGSEIREADDTAPVSMSAKEALDAIGVAIRGGMLSPQVIDEAAVREMLGLPPMTPAVQEQWKEEPVRRPITITQPKEEAVSSDSDEVPAEPRDDDEATQELEAEGYDTATLAMYQPPSGARGNAQKVLDWKKEHGSEVKGMTSVGWGRARQLASGDPISEQTVKKMASFNRHRKNAEVAPELKGTPWKDAGYVAWLGWGGTTGINWALRISEGLRG